MAGGSYGWHFLQRLWYEMMRHGWFSNPVFTEIASQRFHPENAIPNGRPNLAAMHLSIRHIVTGSYTNLPIWGNPLYTFKKLKRSIGKRWKYSVNGGIASRTTRTIIFSKYIVSVQAVLCQNKTVSCVSWMEIIHTWILYLKNFSRERMQTTLQLVL